MHRLARRLLLPLSILALVLSGFALPAHAAAADVWTKWNLGDKWIRSLDYVGTDLVAGSETSGVFRSPSAAGPWTDVSSNLTTVGKQVRMTESLGSTVYLATSAGLFKGNGTGGAWTQIGVDESIPSYQRLDQGGVQSVRFPTGSASYLVVGTAGSGRDGIFYSSDSGQHWTKAGGFTGGAYYLTDSGSTMYAAGTTGFWRSTDGGKTWTLRSDGIPGGESAKRIEVGIIPTQLVAATVGGVYRSDNSGATWYPANGSGPGLLNVQEVRAFQLVPTGYWNAQIPRIVVGTNNGVWATLDGGLNWAKLSSVKVGAPGGEVNMAQESVYSLNIGFTPTSLVAGTQGHGVFTLPLQIAEPPASIPAPSGSPTQNSLLIAQNGAWAGTAPFVFSYQWRRCNQSSASDASGSTCSSIADATGASYQPGGADVGKYIRVGIRARSLVMPSLSAEVLSASIGPITAPPGPVPAPPASWPKLLNAASAPWGQTLTIQPSNPESPQNGNWNATGTPTATTYTYLWLRCDSGGSNCVSRPNPGNSATYQTTTADVNHIIEGRVIGTIGNTSSDDRLAGLSGVVYEQTPAPVTSPRIVGQAFVGRTLQSTVGSWTGNGPTYARRWFRCNAQGLQCGLTNPLVTAPTYVVQPGDKGYTFRVEVKASVTDSFMTRTGTKESAPSAVVTDGPPPCSTIYPAVAAAKAAYAKAAKAAKKAKKAYKKAKKSGKKAKIKRAKKKLKKANKAKSAAKKKLEGLQALSTAGAC